MTRLDPHIVRTFRPVCLSSFLTRTEGWKRRLPATPPTTQKGRLKAVQVPSLQREGDGAAGERESPVRIDRGDRAVWTAVGLALRVIQHVRLTTLVLGPKATWAGVRLPYFGSGCAVSALCAGPHFWLCVFFLPLTDRGREGRDIATIIIRSPLQYRQWSISYWYRPPSDFRVSSEL